MQILNRSEPYSIGLSAEYAINLFGDDDEILENSGRHECYESKDEDEDEDDRGDRPDCDDYFPKTKVFQGTHREPGTRKVSI